MTKEEFRTHLSYWAGRAKLSEDDIASGCKVSVPTVRRWLSGKSAPHPLGRDSVISKLISMEPITKENLNENVKTYLKDNLKICAEEMNNIYYAGDPISIEIRLVLEDKVISTDWISVYP